MKVQIDKIKWALLEEKKVRLSLLRSDLIHEHWSGNKYYKLKYNLEEAKRQKKQVLLTFGGAFSNHIAATAAAGKAHNLKTIGVIRGEENSSLNPTLSFAKACGMELHFISRALYRQKKTVAFVESMHEKFGDFYLIPEGGSNVLAVKGCSEILDETIDFDVVCCACGTGATLAGIIISLKEKQRAIGFSSLKGGEFLEEDVCEFLSEYCLKYGIELPSRKKWEMKTAYHFGGYAKTHADLFSFHQRFLEENQIELDLVYTAKMMYGIFDLIKNNYFPEGTRIVALHSGGLQGNSGIKMRKKEQK